MDAMDTDLTPTSNIRWGVGHSREKLSPQEHFTLRACRARELLRYTKIRRGESCWQGARAGDKSIVMARVCCGGTATRDLLGSTGTLAEELLQIENRIPPPGFQSATSQQV